MLWTCHSYHDLTQCWQIWHILRQNRNWKLSFCGLTPIQIYLEQHFGPHLRFRGLGSFQKLLYGQRLHKKSSKSISGNTAWGHCWLLRWASQANRIEVWFTWRSKCLQFVLYCPSCTVEQKRLSSSSCWLMPSQADALWVSEVWKPYLNIQSSWRFQDLILPWKVWKGLASWRKCNYLC